MKSLALAIFWAGLFFACSKKPGSFNNGANFTAALKVQANDEVRISSELDAAFNDVDSVAGGAASVCGATIAVDSVDSPRVIKITYSGQTCDALRSRSGSISIAYTPGSSWNTAGDSLVVSFTTLTITRLADYKTLTLNGSFMYRNISGGSLAGLNTGGTTPVVHTLTGSNITLTYDDGTITNWQFTRQRTYTYSGGLVISTLGLDSAGTIGGVADWGANRFGNSVVAVPTSAWVISQACGWRTTGGQATLTNPVGATTLTFGLDSTGKATGCPVNGGHYYYQLGWTGQGENPYSTLLPY
jgi:hypothetical protein